jgi:hypothetical protein
VAAAFGLLLLPFMKERLVFLALLAVPAGYLLTTAQVEFLCLVMLWPFYRLR